MQRFNPHPGGPDNCLRCGGLLELARDHFGAYFNCLICGHHMYPQEPQGVANLPRQEAPGEAAPGPGARWCPTTQRCQGIYRERLEIIQRERLTVAQAALRFDISIRTIYRILDGRPPE